MNKELKKRVTLKEIFEKSSSTIFIVSAFIILLSISAYFFSEEVGIAPYLLFTMVSVVYIKQELEKY